MVAESAGFCYGGERAGNWPNAVFLTLAPKDDMTWRVATRSGKATLEVIDPVDWYTLTTEQQGAFLSVSEFNTEQEAEKYAIGRVELTKPVRHDLPRR